MEPEGTLKREKPERSARDKQRADRIAATLIVTDQDLLDVRNDLGEPGVETILQRIKQLLESSTYSGRMLKQLTRRRCKQLCEAYKERYVETPESTVELGPQRRKLRAEDKQRTKQEKQGRGKAGKNSGTTARGVTADTGAELNDRPTSVARARGVERVPDAEPEKNDDAVFQHPVHGAVTAATWAGFDGKQKRDILDGFSRAYEAGIEQARAVHAFLNREKTIDNAFQTYKTWPDLHRRIVSFVRDYKVGERTFFLWLGSVEILVHEGSLQDDCHKYFASLGIRPYSFGFERVSKSKWKETGSRSDTKAHPDAKPYFTELFREAGNTTCKFL